jgi:hypothetical protein
MTGSLGMMPIGGYSNGEALDAALCEVRKAYRLLWLSQRRVFDICETIRDGIGVAFWTVGYHFDRPPHWQQAVQEVDVGYVANEQY